MELDYCWGKREEGKGSHEALRIVITDGITKEWTEDVDEREMAQKETLVFG